MEAAVVPLQRLRVAAEALADHALLVQQPRVPVERACAAVRLLGVRVEADELADVAERLPDPRDLLVGQLELGPDLERSAVEAGSFDVGELLLGPLARRERVAVRLLAVARVEEVQGQELRELAAALVLEPLVRLADLRVQFAAP